MKSAARRRMGARDTETRTDVAATTPRRIAWALPLILALTAFLRLFEITSIPPPLNFDEAMNGNDAMENIENGSIHVFYAQNGGREGLYINLETALIYLFGNRAWLLRVPAAIFGTLTVWGLYWLARELFSEPIGLFAAFLCATSFWHLLFSRLGLRAIGAPLFFVWALYLLLDALKRFHHGGTYRLRMALAALLYGAGFYTYLAYRVTPALIALVLIPAWLTARKTDAAARLARAAGLYAAIVTATVTPLLLYFVTHPEQLTHHTGELSLFRDRHPWMELLDNIWQTLGMLFVRGDANWLYNISGRAALNWLFAILLIAGLLARPVAAWRAQRTPVTDTDAANFGRMLVLLWLPLAALPAVLSNQGMPSAIRSILMIPAICMVAATGAMWLLGVLSRRAGVRTAQIAGAAAALFLCWDCYHSYFNVWAASPEVTKIFDQASVEIVRRIEALPASTPKYVVPVTPGMPGGMPPPAQTVMFLTGSYTKRQQEATNIHYITRKTADEPDGVDFCVQVARTGHANVFCLVANATGKPK